ncbi:MAG: tetratricopeptide repeat protein [Nannocystaceae bacterium]|nr:tetratricopeptide repeat protein [bacterium]
MLLIEPEWAPADSIPMLDLSAIMEVQPEPEDVHEPEPDAPVAQPAAMPSQPRPEPRSAAIASLSTSTPVAVTQAPRPSDSVVMWKPRRSFSWIMGTAAAASMAVILLGWSLVPTSASAEPQSAPAEQEAVMVTAEAPEPEPMAAPATEPLEATPTGRTAARKWATIGNRQLKDGSLATAQKMFERALEAQANNRMAHEGLGKIALRRNQPRRAVERLRFALKIEPRRAENRRLLGQAYAALGRKGKARTQLQKAIEYGDVPAQQLLMDL